MTLQPDRAQADESNADPFDRLFNGDVRFCVWKTENDKKGKPTKRPYQAVGRKGSSTDPHSWIARPKAEELARGGGQFDGVGIYLGDLPDGRVLAGIDLDTCRDDTSGGAEDWAEEVIRQFESYTEVSPSLTGYKIFFLIEAADRERVLALLDGGEGKRGAQWKLHASGGHPPAIELYTGGRYFTITHKRLAQMPDEIRSVPYDVLCWLIEEHGPAFSRGQERRSERVNGHASAQTHGEPEPDDGEEDEPDDGESGADDADLETRGKAALAHLAEFGRKRKGRAALRIAALLRGDPSYLPGDKSRSTFAIALVGFCKDAGLAKEDARAALYAFEHVVGREHARDRRSFERCWNKARNKARKNLEPLPLVPPHIAQAPYPVGALGGPMAGAAHAIAELTQCPPALAAHSVLAAASLACQGHADVMHPQGRAVPIALALLTVAESGERKSTADARACQAFEQATQDGEANYRLAYARWRNACEANEAARAAVKRGKKTDAHAIRAALDAIPAAPSPPLNPRRVVSDPNWEGLLKFMLTAHGSLGWFNNEAGQSIGGTAMHDDNRLKFSAGLSKFWDGQSIDRIRAGDGAHVLSGRRLTVHLMVQPDIARPFLADPVLRAQGWLSRVLACEPQSTIGVRPFRPPGAVAQAALARFSARVRELIDVDCPHGDKVNELAPPALKLNVGAEGAWIAFHDAVEGTLADGGALETQRGWGAKLAENTLRLAAIMAVFEGAGEVDETHMRQAVALGDWYAREATRQFERAQVSADLALAERTRLWLTDTGRWSKPTVTVRDVMRSGPNPARAKAKAEAVVSILCEHGWLVRDEDAGPFAIRGRKP